MTEKKNSLKNKVIGGLAWKFAERFSNQLVSFVVSVLLARLLTPNEYGLIALMNVFILIANVLVVGGLNTSLIQKKNADDLDFSTVFYCTLILSIIVYALIFIMAPFMAKYYSMPELTLLMRIFSLSLFILSYHSIQNAYVSRHMMFKCNFYATFVGALISGIVGIIMAYAGYGVWALVVQCLLSNILNAVVLSVIVDWRPKLMFSWNRAKDLIGYGSKILGSSLVNTIYKEIRQLLIGLYYAPVDLALYNRGSQLPNIVTTNLDNSLRSVLFPAMANCNDDIGKVKQMLRKSIMNTSYITYFVLTLMAVASEPLIRVLLTDKWIGCVPYMQILCVSYMLMTVSITNIQALKAIGKSGEVLKLELFKKPIFLIVVLASLPFGVKVIAYTSIINALYALWANMGPTAKYLSYSRKEQMRDLIPGFILAGVMALITWPIVLLPFDSLIIMGLQGLVALITYVSISIFFKVEAYMYCKNIIVSLSGRFLKKK